MGAGVIGPIGVSAATPVDPGLGVEAEAATNHGHETMEKIVKEWGLKLNNATLDLRKVIRIPAPVRLY